MLWDHAWAFIKGARVLADANSGIQIGRGKPGISGWGLGRRGGQIYFNALIHEVYNNLTSLRLRLQASSDATSVTTGTWVDVIDTGQIVRASLVRGYKLWSAPLPTRDDLVDVRWLRTNVDIVGNAPTTGRITAFLDDGPIEQRGLSSDVLEERLPTSIDYFPGDDTRTS